MKSQRDDNPDTVENPEEEKTRAAAEESKGSTVETNKGILHDNTVDFLTAGRNVNSITSGGALIAVGVPLGLHKSVEAVAHGGDVLYPLNNSLRVFALDGLQVDHVTTEKGKRHVDDRYKGDGSSLRVES